MGGEGRRNQPKKMKDCARRNEPGGTTRKGGKSEKTSLVAAEMKGSWVLHATMDEEVEYSKKGGSVGMI